MPDVGVRELKARASEIMRDVRDRKARYVITYRGRPVGVLLPLESRGPSEKREGGWEEFFRLIEEYREGWPDEPSSDDVLSSMRR